MWLGLELKNERGLLALANADLLLGRILKAVLGDLYNVVLEFEIGYAQLAGLSGLRLKFSVEKHACVILADNDEECAQTVTNPGGRLNVFRLISARDFSGTRRQSRGRWFGSCLCGTGDSGSGGDRGRNSRWDGSGYVGGGDSGA